MNRPILYWLNKLPAGYKELAVANAVRAQRDGRDCGRMHDAINLMCRWGGSPEGSTFWSAVFHHYEARDYVYQHVPAMPALPANRTTN